MLLRIKRIGDFDFARVEKSMPIFETIFINLHLSPDNVIISQLHFLQLNFGLQNITISNFTVRYIRLNPKYIIWAYFHNIWFDSAIIFYQNYGFFFNDVVVTEDNLFRFILTYYRAGRAYYTSLAKCNFSYNVVVA